MTQPLTASYIGSSLGLWGGSVALADLDGNGDKEIVVGTLDENSDADDFLFAFDYAGGGLTAMTGWPVVAPNASTLWMQVLDYNGDGDEEIITMFNYYGYIDVRQANGTYWRMPKVGGQPPDERVFANLACWADMDKDGQLEVVSPHRGTPNITIRSLTGAVEASWSYGADLNISEGVAVGDLDLDGDMEVVVLDNVVGMNVFHHNGTPFALFPNGSKTGLAVTQGNNHTAVANVDADPEPEILYCSSAGYLYVIERDGTTKFSVNEARVGFSLLDYDKDGDYEILYGQRLYRSNGAVVAQLPGVPVAGTFAALADFNGDAVPEAVYVSGAMQVNVYDLVAGAAVAGWPQTATGSERLGVFAHWWASTPVVADLDGNGGLEVLVVTGTDDSNSTVAPVLNLWSTSTPVLNWPAGKAQLNAWPVFYHDPMNTTAFPMVQRTRGTAVMIR